MAIGLSKTEVYQDLHEVISDALFKTGDNVLENYIFFMCENLYHTLEIWVLSDNEEPILQPLNGRLTKFKGISIVMTTTETDYFYLKYFPQNGENITFMPKRFQAA